MSVVRRGVGVIRFYLTLLLILVNVCEEIFRKLESDGKENEQRVEDLSVQSLMKVSSR